MGAGDAPAGHTPAGLGVQTLSAPYTPSTAPAAIRLDVKNRDASLDSSGRYEDMGTIEQQVAIAFAHPRGSLKHSPNTGHDFLDLPRVVGAELDAAIERAAKQATPFDRLLASGKIEFLGISSQHPKRTESRVVIEWRKTGDTTTRTALVGTR